MISSKKIDNGYIAVISSIIISAVLLAMIISGSLSSYFALENLLDRQNKIQSDAIAHSCIVVENYKLNNDKTYKAPSLLLGQDFCTVSDLNNLNQNRSFIVMVRINHSVTKILAQTSGGEIVWQEQ